MLVFYIDDTKRIKKTYKDLYFDLMSKSSVKKYIYEKNAYTFFVELLFGVLQDKQITILDGDYSKEEIERLGENYSQIHDEDVCQRLDLSYEDFLIYLNTLTSNCTLSIFTSGTTGNPKKVTHNLATLMRTAKVGGKFKDDVWGFAYNFSHIAGLQVLFQAIRNLNPIVNIINQPYSTIQEVLEREEVSNISATSTFYRTITPFISKTIKSVRYITFGGEKFDDSFIKGLQIKFPNAQIRNIYASTEAGSLFTAKGNAFLIPTAIKPFVKLSEDNELMIHKSLLGDIKDNMEVIVEEWFFTGDVVEKKNDEEFIFVSRKSDIINVGGYNVNPHEVELELFQLPFIVDVIVKARVNRITGNIIAADIIIDNSLDEADAKKIIKSHLSTRLQVWKIPRIIKVVDSFPHTRTGKKVRK